MTSRQAKIQEDTHFRIMRFLQDAHDLKMGVFLDLGLTAGHGGSFKVVLKGAKIYFGQATAVPCHDQQCGFGVG